METSLISYNSKEYSEMIALRKRILRDPLKLDFSPEDLSKDKDDILCGYYNEHKKLIGTCILTKIDNNFVQLRQMAVDPNYQGEGIGAKLLSFAEEVAKNHLYKGIKLHARKVALLFYKKQGYNIVGDEFIEIGIPHQNMEKQI